MPCLRQDSALWKIRKGWKPYGRDREAGSVHDSPARGVRKSLKFRDMIFKLIPVLQLNLEMLRRQFSEYSRVEPIEIYKVH